ncbi:MAG TPA: peptide-methionine (S)-S-oxide reductase MsrA [Gallionellaceae bacterium]
MSDKQTATLAGGCFWCLEAVYEQMLGVERVVSGYIAGTKPNPSYEEVCTGSTGHAEAVQITFDPGQVTYGELLSVFFTIHDPTTLNRQGNDVGTQYRSAIYYHNEDQRAEAAELMAELRRQHVFPDPLVTELVAISTFYPAETYHQHYYANHPSQGYCQFVVAPKMEKFRKHFAAKMK